MRAATLLAISRFVSRGASLSDDAEDLADLVWPRVASSNGEINGCAVAARAPRTSLGVWRAPVALPLSCRSRL